jgi:hypothetical protein
MEEAELVACLAIEVAPFPPQLDVARTEEATTAVKVTLIEKASPAVGPLDPFTRGKCTELQHKPTPRCGCDAQDSSGLSAKLEPYWPKPISRSPKLTSGKRAIGLREVGRQKCRRSRE